MNITSWSREAETQQLNWRKKKEILIGRNGKQNGVEKDYILPANEWLLGTWDDADFRKLLSNYLEVDQIQANNWKHNLKSSWTQCANIFFSFRYHPHLKNMLASFLKRELDLEITSIDGVELEYAAPGKLSPRYLLGEQGGKRGSGQTSPDVAVTFTCRDGKCGIYLIENKYTEHHFYACSAAKKTLSPEHKTQGLECNPAPERCKNIKKCFDDPERNCHQVKWGRQYFPILLKSINEAAFLSLPYCPAMKDGYQLFRQHALAQGFVESGLFDYVYSGVAYDDRNHGFIGCLSELGLPDFREDWTGLFNSASKVNFHCFSHQDLLSWVMRSRSPYVQKWGKYVTERYGYN
ncbi:MAG TPA: hypothetical protein VLH15_05760 [Dehalococcoidales bacterium]|nr:hypothetical protein [Dehalococcoidales bacterium]